MERRSLRTCVAFAAMWFLGVTLYSIYWDPMLADKNLGIQEEREIKDAAAPVSVALPILADQHMPKNVKMPVHWAHQRWGAN